MGQGIRMQCGWGTGEWSEMRREGWAGACLHPAGECASEDELSGRWEMVCFLAVTLSSTESHDEKVTPFSILFQALTPSRGKSQLLTPNTCDPHRPQGDCFPQATVTTKNSVTLLCFCSYDYLLFRASGFC